MSSFLGGGGSGGSGGLTVGVTTIAGGTPGDVLFDNGGVLGEQPATSGRIAIAVSTTYYVRTTGNDANNGLTAGTAWLTLQHAANFTSKSIDTGGFDIFVNIGAGSFAGAGVKPLVGGGTLQFIGAGSGSTTITSGPNDGVYNFGECFSLLESIGAVFAINSLKMVQSITNTDCVAVYASNQLVIIGDPNFVTPSDIITVTSPTGFAFNTYNFSSLSYSPGTITFDNTANLANMGAIKLIGGSVQTCAAHLVSLGSPTWGGGGFLLVGQDCYFDGATFGMTVTRSGTELGLQFVVSGIAMLNGQTLPGSIAGQQLIPGFVDSVGWHTVNTDTYIDIATSNGTTTINLDPRIAFIVPNGSGDNFFDGESGNNTLTGFNNLGTGFHACQNLTTGSGNVGFGAQSLLLTTTGGQNLAVGYQTLRNCTSGNQNVTIGYAAGAGTFPMIASASVAIGALSLGAMIDGNENVGIGASAGAQITHGAANTLIRFGAGFNLIYGSNNRILGDRVTPTTDVNNTILVGIGAGDPNIKADYNYRHADKWTFIIPIVFPTYTVGTLPAGIAGAKAIVSDALAPAFLAPVVGGGAVSCPVFYSASAAAWCCG